MSAIFWRACARFLSRPAVVDWLIRRGRRQPYTPIITDGVLYMERLWLFNPYPATGGSGADRSIWQFPISIRLHHICEPDQDRHNHDHPWHARTIVARGGYDEDRIVEFTSDGAVTATFERRAGDTATLRFGEYHRITSVQPDTWTIFITGRYRGIWGFLVDGVKVPWRQYLGLEQKP